jgi:uncharacterized protein YaaN involved in tellurite resistance
MKPLFGAPEPQNNQNTNSVESTPVVVSSPFQPAPPLIHSSQPVFSTPTSALATPAAPTPVVLRSNITEEQVLQLGDASSRKVSALSEQLLSLVRAGDSDQFGTNLNQLVVTAKGFDPKTMFDNSLIGKFKKLFKSGKEMVQAQFKTVSQQIDTLVTELDRSARLYQTRIHELEEMFANNEQEYHTLGQNIEQGQQMLLQMQDDIARSPEPKDPMEAQKLADHKQLLLRLEKRVDDLKRAQMIAMQTAPEIRLLQNNSRMLIAKFQDIVAITIPAWKKQFSLQLLMEEQQKSAELVTKIDDATNDALKRNADLLRQNTTTITKANQRALVDMQTLEHVQKQLLGSFDDMQKIHEEARAQRAQTDAKIGQMRDELLTKFSQK